MQESNPMPTSKDSPKWWTKHVMQTSDALDLERGVFSMDDPESIARSLKRSAEKSTRRKERAVSLRDVDAELLH